ncbi:organelle RRM domain-containing protein 6, chloroplastic isoform X2 [Musa acuminata AAA Group]|uniref:organelle RRM domain-containing protein 6, chloroplastic isoform X2 n=1 Tax=Musa acuminata AAA Group TaxID=214697 RepID=UPI0031DA2BBC
MATGLLPAASLPPSSSSLRERRHPPDITSSTSSSSWFLSRFPSIRSSRSPWPSAATSRRRSGGFSVSCCLPPTPSTKLYVSGLSFRTTEESLRNAFQNFGQLVEVNLVMDRIANRPRGFAFLRYATEEESKKAIEGMHGKFLDGRVIFVEVAKPRSDVRQASRQTPERYRS